MNEFDLARLERTKRRIVSDPNRLSNEGPTRNPAHCHDYGPEPKTNNRARILAAMEQMEVKLGMDKAISVEALA